MFTSLADRRARLAAALPLHDGLLVLGAGTPVPLPENTDQTYPFRAHSEFFYVAGVECPGAIAAFDPRDGPRAGWRLFVPEVTEDERVWEAREQVDGEPLAALAAWLTARRARPLALLGAALPGARGDDALTAKVREAFTHARRPKDGPEVATLRRGAAAAAAGYARAAALIAPGATERAIQIELEAEFCRHGAQRPGYGTIVGTGPHAAVFHFEPGDRAARDGEFVLIDAGPEVDRYVIDVTRTYVAGRPSAFQRDLYQVVLAAQVRAVNRCTAGAEWRDLHLQCAVELTAGLVALGLMRGDPAALVEREAHFLFFPHGIGHMVGLGVRDASGMLPGRAKDPRPCLANLRMDLPLAPGYFVTVEPGLYFIPAILNDPRRREKFRDCVAWEKVEPYLGLGGVRIEDNVLVTVGAPEVLTAAIPKSL
ncbi:MAG TPA: aminopeptidase P N-terminal domain-containing protein [Opitutaceae bacterium]|nr:aminopeptidase P N-terminal domain-containing protein [Opitutaceae bacterium]